MAYTYFDFKQFRVEQDSCGMKVSTDACLQGAWTPLPEGILRILDVGAGTGLLSLMLAQRAPEAVIDALEIDEAAARQAARNIATSPFADRITVHHADARCWHPAHLYDLIICNPPFFMNSLTGPEAARNLARHHLTLHQEDLLALFERALKQNGQASVLWPAAEGILFKTLAEGKDWHLCGQLSVRHADNAAVKRVVAVYARSKMPARAQILTIKNSDGGYTDAFRQLLFPFYLSL